MQPKNIYYPQFLITFILITFMSLTSIASPKLAYHVSMDDAHTHYFDVEIKISDWDQENIDLKMAVWTPGSYLVREFARQIEGFEASSGTETLAAKKINKNTWRIENKDAKAFSVKYRVYAFEFSVRTCFLDASYGYINAAGLLLYIDKMQDLSSTLHIKPYKGWEQISTSLKPVDAANPWVLNIPNYDLLVDSPIAIGNFEVLDFEAAGIPHSLALIGEGNFDTDIMVKDIQKIATVCTDVFGEHPCEDYTIINFSTNSKYGGLEHLSSTSLMYPRWSYYPPERYNRWRGLMCHEYFHLWNIKRIRPEPLGPFDYENENYTTSLWIAEGITSYYDDYLLRRSEIITEDQYLTILANNINTFENKPGKNVQSLTEASFDAWIKYYRADENFNNSNISYYTKGAVVATLLDLEIRQLTKGKKSLDDVMHQVYKVYFKELDRGFSEAEFQKMAEEVAGADLNDFFQNYVHGTTPIDYQKYFDYLGLKISDANASSQKLSLGIRTKDSNGRLIINRIKKGSCSYNGGLNVNDELVALDGYRIKSTSDIETFIAQKKEGDQIVLTITRKGKLMEVPIQLSKDQTHKYQISKLTKAKKAQKELYKAWMGL